AEFYRVAQVEELQASKKSLEERAARGSAQDDQPDDDIVQLNKPPGEAGDKKRGFSLQTAMDLDGDDDLYGAIQRTMHDAVARAHLDASMDFREQAPDKLSAVFKLMRKDHAYLTKKRFPLDWASAEMVK
ncbi:hypothetical protein B0H14DRAFT_2269676, partial [Mycena olivaceomarginata]